ncbi:MAG: hypothetical protein HY329_01665, partial [Chloroflexi bacterium]|nr:hypothetical protein [Chloroflexota bacterium]
LSGIYAGSLFLALAIAAFYYARCQRWWLAGGLGGAAALSRPYGVFLVVPLVFEYLAQRRATRQALGPDAIALRLIPAAFGGYLLYLAWHFGHPLVFLDAYTAWGMRPMSPWETLERFWSAPLVLHGTEHSLLDLAFTATFVLLAIITWRYLRPSCALYASVLLLVMVSMGTLQSVMRYGLTLFPAFMVLAHVGRHRWFDCAYVISAVSLSILLMVLFAMGHWVA